MFLGANIKRLHHFIQPIENKSDAVLIHIESNDIPSKQHNLNVNNIVQKIIDNGLY